MRPTNLNGLRPYLAICTRAFRRCTSGASLMEYTTVLGLVALVSVAAVGGTGRTASQALCTATQGIRSVFFDEAVRCSPDGEVVADLTPDLGGGEGTTAEPPMEDGFVFDTTGLVFPNVVLAEGTVDTQTLLTNFAGVYSTDVEYQVRRLDTSSPLDRPATTGIIVSDAGEDLTTSTTNAAQTWSSWRRVDTDHSLQIGLRMTPPADATQALAAYYEVALRPVERPSLTEVFSFSVTRAGGPVVFDPDFAVADVALPAGTIGAQDILFDLKGAFNTDLTYQIRRNGAINAEEQTYERIRNARLDLRFGDTASGRAIGNASSASSRINPADTTQLGLTMTPSANIFQDVSAQYDLLLSSVSTPDDVRSYTFNVTRPADTLVFAPELAVHDIVLPVGTTGAQEALFDLSGEANTDIVFSVRRVDAQNMQDTTYARRQPYASYANNTGSALLDAQSPTQTYSMQDAGRLGIGFAPSDNIFEEVSATYEIYLAAAQSPETVRTFTFTVTRPADTVVFEPELVVSDIVLPAGTDGAQDALFKLSGQINTDIVFSVRRVAAENMQDTTYARRQAYGASPANAGGAALDAQTPVQTYKSMTDVDRIGVGYTLPDSIFVDASATYEIHLASAQTPEDVRTYSFTVTRPADTVVFEPQIAVQDVVLEPGTTGQQDVLFAVSGNMNTDMIFSLRRVDAQNMGDTTEGRRKPANGFVTMAGGSVFDATSAAQAYAIEDASQLGVRVTPDQNIFVDAQGSYELYLASTETPDEVHTFSFTVSRAADDVVFEPQMAVQDVVLPAGTTGQRDIMFDLSGDINTDILFAVRRVGAENIGANTLARYTGGSSSFPRSLGGITDNATSPFYTTAGTMPAKFGVRIDLGSEYATSTGTYEMLIASAQAPDQVSTYTFTVSREALPFSFEPQLAVSDTAIAPGSKGNTVTTFDLSFATPTSAQALLFDVRRTDQQNLDPRTWPIYADSSGRIFTYAAVQNDTRSSSVKIAATASKLGIMAAFPDDIFMEAGGTYEIRVAPEEVPDMVRTFTFTTTRAADTVRFTPELAVENITLAPGTSGSYDALFDLGGTMNTDMQVTITRSEGQGMGSTTQGLRAIASGATYTAGSLTNDASTTTTVDPSTAAKFGVRIALPSDSFARGYARYTIEMASVFTPQDKRAFSFTIDRPAQEIVFEPQVAVQDITLPVAASAQNILFKMSGQTNTDILYSLRRVAAQNMDNTTKGIYRRTSDGGLVNLPSTTSSTPSAPSTLPAGTVAEIGLYFQPTTSTYADASATYEMTLASAKDPSQVRTFTFTVTRPGNTLIFTKQVVVNDIVIPAGTTTAQTILFDVTGEANTNISYSVRRVDSLNMQATTTGRYRHTNNTVYSTSSVSGDTTSAPSNIGGTVLAQLGVLFTPSTDVYQEVRATYELRLASAERPDEVRTFTFTVTRPAQEFVFEPQIAVQDITVPAGTNTFQKIIFPLSGRMDSNFTYTVRRVQSSNMQDMTYGLYYYNGTKSGKGVSGDGITAAVNYSPAQVTGLGVQITPSTTTNIEARAVYELRVAPINNPTEIRTFTFTFTRPAQ